MVTRRRSSVTIHDWRDIEDEWTGDTVLMLGNGASIAVWDEFSYASLFEQARKPPQALSDSDAELFDRIGTQDFERVLSALQTTETVLEVLGKPAPDLEVHYNAIQTALLNTLVAAHPDWGAVPSTILRPAYRLHKAVYTTNYDLLLYWAIQPANNDFVDHFRVGRELRFDPQNTHVPARATELLFLHGAIQLRRTADDGTRKVRWHPGESILDAMFIPFDEGETALFVSEGSSKEKERRIGSSDYLSFAYERLQAEERPMVVVGQKFGPEDGHILRAVNAHPTRGLAVGIRRVGNYQQKAHELMARIDSAEVTFFDSRTHPLTGPDVRISKP